MLYNVYEGKIKYNCSYEIHKFYGKGEITMKKKNKKIAMIVCMVTGVCLLGGAVAANYSTANGYDVYKKAVKGLVGRDNYTMDVSLKLALDGNTLSETHTYEQADAPNGMSCLLEENKGISDDYYYRSEDHNQDNINYMVYTNTYKNEDGEKETNTHGNAWNYAADDPDRSLGSLNISRNEDETMKKVMRVVELAADTFVGDLKNNIVYVSGDDTQSTYEINLDYIQIPEIVNAGLSAIFSMEYGTAQQNGYEPSNEFQMLGKDPIVRSASMTFTVDNEGRLLANHGTASMVGIGMDGTEHELTIEANLEMSNYGTTTVERFDPSTMPEDTSYYDRDAQQSYHVQFDSDGNIVYKEAAESVG